jgi:hypothetical protein
MIHYHLNLTYCILLQPWRPWTLEAGTSMQYSSNILFEISLVERVHAEMQPALFFL